jgi:hypothetical protein
VSFRTCSEVGNISRSGCDSAGDAVGRDDSQKRREVARLIQF